MAKDTSIPSLTIPPSGISINITITGTDALVENQGYTYNNAGLTYNSAGVFYGGVYNANQEIVPIIAGAKLTQPVNIMINDIYTNNTPPPPNHQKVVGVGFWMYVAQV